MKRILVIYASAFGQTKAIATRIADRLRLAGNTVELADVHGRPPSPDEFDAAVLGARVQGGKHGPEMSAYVERHRTRLSQIPSAFFSVSMSAATASMGPDPHAYIATFLKAVDWRPDHTIAIAGGLPYRKYNPVLRLVMRFMSWRGGHTTDTSRDHEYTDWNQVTSFADDLAAAFASRSSSPGAPHAA